MFTDGMLGFIHKYETKIEFSRIGHDLSLDFVKGVCILLVILNHSTGFTFHQDSWFFLWGYPAVPLFLLIQVYHSYKKDQLGKHLDEGIFPIFISSGIAIYICCYYATNKIVTFYIYGGLLLGRGGTWLLLSVDLYPICISTSLTSSFIPKNE